MPFFETGTFASGTIERNEEGGLQPTSFQSSMTGSTAKISLANITLIPSTGGCTGMRGNCTFDSGTVTVVDPTTDMTLFTGSLVRGHITKNSVGATITADVLPVSKIFAFGGVVDYVAAFSEPGGALTGGSAVVSGVIPEPGTLCLLGTSVIGFAGIARRRLKLGR
jgi:hypothetical protein